MFRNRMYDIKSFSIYGCIQSLFIESILQFVAKKTTTTQRAFVRMNESQLPNWNWNGKHCDIIECINFIGKWKMCLLTLFYEQPHSTTWMRDTFFCANLVRTQRSKYVHIAPCGGPSNAFASLHYILFFVQSGPRVEDLAPLRLIAPHVLWRQKNVSDLNWISVELFLYVA